VYSLDKDCERSFRRDDGDAVATETIKLFPVSSGSWRSTFVVPNQELELDQFTSNVVQVALDGLTSSNLGVVLAVNGTKVGKPAGFKKTGRMDMYIKFLSPDTTGSSEWKNEYGDDSKDDKGGPGGKIRRDLQENDKEDEDDVAYASVADTPSGSYYSSAYGVRDAATERRAQDYSALHSSSGKSGSDDGDGTTEGLERGDRNGDGIEAFSDFKSFVVGISSNQLPTWKWLGFTDFTTGEQMTGTDRSAGYTSALLPSNVWLYCKISVRLADLSVVTTVRKQSYSGNALQYPYTDVTSVQFLPRGKIRSLLKNGFVPIVFETSRVDSKSAKLILGEFKIEYAEA